MGKRTALGLTLAALAAAAFTAAGCRKTTVARPPDGLRILCSTYPMYLFTRAVVGAQPDVTVEVMVDPDLGCPHDYALTPQDMRKISSADLFVANGLGMEEFLGSPLRRANPKVTVIDSSAGLDGLIAMEHEEDEGHAPSGAAAGDEAHHHHPGGSNPHLFASPRQAARVVRNIAAQLGQADPARALQYKANADAFARRLDALAEEFAAALKGAPNRGIVTQHAVFDYLARDCGLAIVAVVEEDPGHDPSASAAEMIALKKAIQEKKPAALFTEPQYKSEVARKLGEELGVPVARLDPVASGPADAGPDYYEKVMRENLRTLTRILRGKE